MLGEVWKRLLYSLLGIWSSQFSFSLSFYGVIKDKTKMLPKFRRVFWSLYLQGLLRTEVIHLSLCTKRLIEKSMSVYTMEQLWCIFYLVNFSCTQRHAHQLRKPGCILHQEQRNLVVFSFCFLMLFSCSCAPRFPSVPATSYPSLIRPLLSPAVLSSYLCSPGLR